MRIGVSGQSLFVGQSGCRQAVAWSCNVGRYLSTISPLVLCFQIGSNACNSPAAAAGTERCNRCAWVHTRQASCFGFTYASNACNSHAAALNEAQYLYVGCFARGRRLAYVWAGGSSIDQNGYGQLMHGVFTAGLSCGQVVVWVLAEGRQVSYQMLRGGFLASVLYSYCARNTLAALLQLLHISWLRLSHFLCFPCTPDGPSVLGSLSVRPSASQWLCRYHTACTAAHVCTPAAPGACAMVLGFPVRTVRGVHLGVHVLQAACIALHICLCIPFHCSTAVMVMPTALLEHASYCS